MTSERGRVGLSLALAAGLFAACADFKRGPAGQDIDGGTFEAGPVGDGGAPSFATVHALLDPACGACHATGKEAGDTGLLFSGDATADLTSVLEFVDTGAPSSSRLVTKMAGNGHQGGTVFAPGTAEYLTVVAWIQGGALP
jgi:hypothetical protein